MSSLKNTIIVLLISLTISQVPTGYALNGCGPITDYSQPTQKSDCNVDKSEGYKCCFIKSTSKNFAYCAYVPGKIDDDIIEDLIFKLNVIFRNLFLLISIFLLLFLLSCFKFIFLVNFFFE